MRRASQAQTASMFIVAFRSSFRDKAREEGLDAVVWDAIALKKVYPRITRIFASVLRENPRLLTTKRAIHENTNLKRDENHAV